MRPNWMLILVLGTGLASCQTYGNDEMARYLQRKEGVTMSGGDANQQNIMAQTLQPWPPGVGDRRIPMEGTRAARAIQSYNCDNAQTKTTASSQAGMSPSGGISITSKAETKKDC